MIAPAPRSSWTPTGSSARMASGRGSPARSAPRSPRSARRMAPPSMPTTRASPGTASSSSSPRGRSPGCSPPTTGRRASGSARPRPMPRRSAAGPGPAWRRSASCWSVRRRSWPSGCVMLAVPRRSRACFASPTSCGRRSVRAGRWSGTRVITVTRSPPTASATRSATPSSGRRARPGAHRGRRGGGRRAGGLPAATRPGAGRDLRDHLPPGGLPAGADVRPAAEAAGRRHRHPGGGAGRPADPRQAPAGDRLTGPRRPGRSSRSHPAITRQPASKEA